MEGKIIRLEFHEEMQIIVALASSVVSLVALSWSFIRVGA